MLTVRGGAGVMLGAGTGQRVEQHSLLVPRWGRHGGDVGSGRF